MDEELIDLLALMKSKPEQVDNEDDDIRIAVANGLISDKRVTVEALKAAQTITKAQTEKAA
jgi:hypothetical protein